MTTNPPVQDDGGRDAALVAHIRDALRYNLDRLKKLIDGAEDSLSVDAAEVQRTLASVLKARDALMTMETKLATENPQAPPHDASPQIDLAEARDRLRCKLDKLRGALGPSEVSG